MKTDVMNKVMVIWRKVLLFYLFTFLPLSALAQWQMQPTPNDTLQPVRNLGGGKVAFSIYAPNAKEVGGRLSSATSRMVSIATTLLLMA